MKHQYDPDTNPETGIFWNKANISDKKELEIFEHNMTIICMRSMVVTPIKGSFDATHLKTIHSYIFSDVYPWAGEYRTVETSSRAPFAKPEYISGAVDTLLNELQQENFSRDASHVAKRLAYYYTELNAIHPFREGNGRTLCQFIYDLAYANSWNLNWTAITEKQLNEAAAEGMHTTPELLTKLFQKNIREASLKKERTLAKPKPSANWNITR